MKNKVYLFAIFLGAMRFGHAIPLCTDYANLPSASSHPGATFGHMSDYIALGGNGCQLGDKIFYDFTYAYANGRATDVPASTVEVRAFNNPLNPVFDFQANWTVTGGQQANMDITYKVFVVDQFGGVNGPPVALIKGATAAITGTVTNFDPNQQFALVSVAETITNATNGDVANLGPFMLAEQGSQTFTIPGCAFNVDINCQSVAISGRQMFIRKDIFLDSGGDGVGSVNTATLTEVQQGLLEQLIPEPVTLLLYGGGLIAFGVLGKLRTRQNRKSLLERSGIAEQANTTTGVAQ
jgi:hypothetical protein